MTIDRRLSTSDHRSSTIANRLLTSEYRSSANDHRPITPERCPSTASDISADTRYSASDTATSIMAEPPKAFEIGGILAMIQNQLRRLGERLARLENPLPLVANLVQPIFPGAPPPGVPPIHPAHHDPDREDITDDETDLFTPRRLRPPHPTASCTHPQAHTTYIRW